jgi:enoyl-CoA hydratase/carnithine racemase
MGDDVVLYEVDDGVALVTFNRPDRMNAWTGELEDRYFDLLLRADAAPEVRAIVVTGAGRGFCPGADMDLLQGLGSGSGDLTSEDRRPVTLPLTVRKPLIGAINGAAAGVGLVQALMFDIRFAAAGAKMTFAFSRRGLIAEYGVSWMLPRLVGTSRALDLLLSSRVIVAEEAAQMGLVNRVVDRESVVDEAMAYARTLAEHCSPASLATIKAQVYRHWDVGLADALEQSNGLMRQSLGGPDFREGVASYVEKRSPAFAPLGDGTTITFGDEADV